MMKVSTDLLVAFLLLGSCAAMEMEIDMDDSEMESASPVAPPRWNTQPTTNSTCSGGVCSKGKWAAYFGGHTEAQCKKTCDDARKLVPEPDGIDEKVYRFRQNGAFHNLNGGKLVPEHQKTVTQINYPGTGRNWKGWSRRDHFYAHWEGKIEIKAAGNYKFWTRSDDGSRLTVNSRQIVNNGGWHGMRWKEGNLDLTAGKFDFWAECFEGGGGAGMELYYQGPDTNNRRVIMPATAFPDKIQEKGYYFRQNGRFHDIEKAIPAKVPLFERKADKIQYRGTGGYWDAEFRKHRLRDHFYVRWSGYIKISAAGEYKFWTVSDDGSRLYVDDASMVQNGGWHGMRWKEGKRQLSAGKHSFWAEMFEGGGGAGMEMYYQGPDTGNKRVIVPKAVLSSSLEGSGKLMLPGTALAGGLCSAYSHEGTHCFIYTECIGVDVAADKICQDNGIDWVEGLADFKTCTYAPHPPAVANTTGN